MPTQEATVPLSTHKLGRLARGHDKRIPMMHNLTEGIAQTPPPAAIDFTKGMPANLGVMLNDTLGDCTCAAFFHALQVWSFNAGAPIDTEPDNDVELLYEKACGYNPAKGGEGPGGNEQKVLTYILKHGAPSGPGGTQVKKIAAFVEVAVTDLDNIKRTVADCGVCYIGFNVPQYIMPPGKAPLSVWDVDPQGDNTIIGGHAVILAGYNAQGARVISWGQYYTMTWAFFENFVDEAYAIADSQWITTKGTTLGGLTLAQLEAAMKELNA